MQEAVATSYEDSWGDFAQTQRKCLGPWSDFKYRLHSVCDHRSGDTCGTNSTWLCGSWPPTWPSDPHLLESHPVSPSTLSQGWPGQPKEYNGRRCVASEALSGKGVTACLGVLGSFIPWDANCHARKTPEQPPRRDCVTEASQQQPALNGQPCG